MHVTFWHGAQFYFKAINRNCTNIVFIYYIYPFLLMLYIKSAWNKEVITLFEMTFLFKDFICESDSGSI